MTSVFRAKIKGEPQTGFIPNVFNGLLWEPAYNPDGVFKLATQQVIPPAGGVLIAAHVPVTGASHATENCVIRITKNGVGVTTGQGAYRNIAGQYVCEISGWADRCNGTDVYDIEFHTKTAAAVLSDNALTVWWSLIAFG